MQAGPATIARGTVIGVALLLAAGCAEETDSEGVEDHASARDTLADELGAILCEGASGCCESLGHADPGETCRSSMRNAVMLSVIEAEHEERALIPALIDQCLAAFEEAIASAAECSALPAPGELALRCPDLFTPAPAPAERSDALPACPHDEATCGYPASGPAPCPGGDCFTLVFENVCR